MNPAPATPLRRGVKEKSLTPRQVTFTPHPQELMEEEFQWEYEIEDEERYWRDTFDPKREDSHPEMTCRDRYRAALQLRTPLRHSTPRRQEDAPEGPLQDSSGISLTCLMTLDHKQKLIASTIIYRKKNKERAGQRATQKNCCIKTIQRKHKQISAGPVWVGI